MSKFASGIRLGVVLVTLGFAPAALAAPPVVSGPVYNWTGLYGGLHFGYGAGMTAWDTEPLGYGVKGFLGGGQLGVNQQIGNWVIGIEAAASWSDIKGSHTTALGGGVSSLLLVTTGETRVDRMITLAGRLGFAHDRWLVYLKGGAAWVHENHRLALTQTVFQVGGTSLLSGSEDRFVPMIGFGVEYALWGNWSFKSEYNYLHLSVDSITAAGSFARVERTEQAFHLAKFGVNYRLGPDGPPAIMPSAPVPGFNWSGHYVGVVGGYAFARKTFGTDDPFDTDGWFAGATIGTNVQAGVFVAGIESEWLWTGIKGSGPGTIVGGTRAATFSSKFDWISIASARLGFVAADRWLVYAKGGVALARETHAIVSEFPFLGGTVVTGVGGFAYHTGLLAGVGIEYAFLGNWSAKVEYNYISFRGQDVTLNGTNTLNTPIAVGPSGTFQQGAVRESLHLVKFGLNYHFDSP